MDEETAQTGADARAYYAQVPAPMVCGTALVTDAEGRILVVEPSYKPGLDLPGGLVLDQESPRQGLARELVEELGLNLEVGRLLAVDTTPAAVHGRALVAHVHAVGPLTAAQVADIRFADGELSSASFLPPAEAVRRLPERLGRRVRGALEAMAAGSIAYLDDGRPQPGSPAGLPAEERIRLEESGTIGRDAHLAMRPKALTSANVLLHDGRGRALIVRPTYRQDGRWLLPGGGIDSDTGETPRAAAQRELREELGFERPLGSLLATDWSPRPTARRWSPSSTTAARSPRPSWTPSGCRRASWTRGGWSPSRSPAACCWIRWSTGSQPAWTRWPRVRADWSWYGDCRSDGAAHRPVTVLVR